MIIGLVLFAFCGLAVAQDEPLVCPVLSVKGPSQILKPGEMARFTVKFEPKKPEWQLKYNWHLSSGRIVSGQGTESIEVEPKIHYVVATAEIGGFRGEEHCPRVASEMVRWDVRPTAEKIKVIPGEKFEPTIGDRSVFDIKGWTDHKLNIFIGSKRDASDEEVRQREVKILEWIGDRLDKNLISIERVFGGVDVTEFWRVPPGAANPKCEGCEPAVKINKPQDCPTISIFGTAGVWLPGDIVDFRLELKGAHVNSFSVVWTVIGGTLVRGQGTSSIYKCGHHRASSNI